MKKEIKYYQLINHWGEILIDSHYLETLKGYKEKHYKGKMVKIIEV